MTILAVIKVGHLNIKTKMASEYSHRVFASQPIRSQNACLKVVFMLRLPAFLPASIFVFVTVVRSSASFSVANVSTYRV